MSVTLQIVRGWRHPRQVVGDLMSGGQREDRALAILIGACFLIFVAQLPRLQRAAILDPEIPFDLRLGGALMATLFVLPLVAYALAGLAHVVGRTLGGGGSFYRARVALFWALLAVAPLMLLGGLMWGLAGPGPGAWLLDVATFAGFLFQWINGMIVAQGLSIQADE